jgi:hypothetical protein
LGSPDKSPPPLSDEGKKKTQKPKGGRGKKIFQEKPREPFTEQFCKEK